MKNFLKKKYTYRISDKIKKKIEDIHGVDTGLVFEKLAKPSNLAGVEKQEGRNPHDETYRLTFRLSNKYRLVVVITYKNLEKKIYIVTAFKSSKDIDKLIRIPKKRKGFI